MAAVGLAVNPVAHGCSATSMTIIINIMPKTITSHSHHHHRDHNLRAAYLHVPRRCPDLGSRHRRPFRACPMVLTWPWIDAVVGLVGACVIAAWSYGLDLRFGRVLL